MRESTDLPTPTDDDRARLQRPGQAHKGSFGTVLVVAGSRGMLGAAILAARAALRGGAGLVRAAIPGASLDAFTVAVPPATTLDRDALGVGQLVDGATAIVCGPGLGQTEAVRGLLDGVLAARGARPTVLDADALNLLAPLPAAGSDAASRLRGCILTPHPGEAARLLGTTTAAVQADRSAAVQELRARSGAIVVLKGAGTLVHDGAQLFRNTTGNPGLATGGSGDVLAGLIGAFLAQGMASFHAALFAVSIHGRAGDLVAAELSQPGLNADDLPLAIARVLARDGAWFLQAFRIADTKAVDTKTADSEAGPA